MPERSMDSPLGPLTLTAGNTAITGLRWGAGRRDPGLVLDAAEAQLTAYFDGARTGFDLPLRIDGSDTQRRICEAIATIPFGATRSYGQIGLMLGLPPQAVGRGCGANPIPILIPCHRVLGANSLGGFSGGAGIDTKVWLLRHERAAGLLI